MVSKTFQEHFNKSQRVPGGFRKSQDHLKGASMDLSGSQGRSMGFWGIRRSQRAPEGLKGASSSLKGVSEDLRGLFTGRC